MKHKKIFFCFVFIGYALALGNFNHDDNQGIELLNNEKKI